MSKNNTDLGGLKPLPKPKAMPPINREKRPRPESRRTRSRPILPPEDEDDFPRQDFPRQNKPKPQKPQNSYPPKRSRSSTRKHVNKNLRRTVRWIRKNVNGRLVGIMAVIVLCVSVIVLQVWSRTTINALAIHVNGEFFAHIPYSSEIQAANIQQSATTRLSHREEAQVVLRDTITIYPVNGQDIISQNEAIERLADGRLNFQIVATIIEVDGVAQAILRTRADAEYVINERLKAPHRRPGVEYYEVEFVQNVQLVSRVVDEADIYTIQEAAQQLTRIDPVMEVYTIRDGDNLGTIAVRFNTSIDQIISDNHGINRNTILGVGNTLSIRTQRPFLSVRTVEIVTRTETIPMTRTERANPNEFPGHQLVINEGQDGEQEITVHITRIDGVLTGEELEHAPRTIRRMTPREVEIGTREVTAERR